jgi:hypothetical protein
MSVPTRARFDDKPLHLQHVIEFEEAILQLACFHDDVVSAGRTGADIVDRAWERAPAHKVTKEAIQKYADDVLKLAQSLHDEVNGGPKVAMYLQDAENPEKRVYCRIGLFDKLQVAIDQYTKMEACQPVHELQYSGIPFADRRVYGYNTPIALNMKDDDVIVVYHNRFEADTAAPPHDERILPDLHSWRGGLARGVLVVLHLVQGGAIRDVCAGLLQVQRAARRQGAFSLRW